MKARVDDMPTAIAGMDIARFLFSAGIASPIHEKMTAATAPPPCSARAIISI